jgi:hypothetical protein
MVGDHRAKHGGQCQREKRVCQEYDIRETPPTFGIELRIQHAEIQYLLRPGRRRDERHKEYEPLYIHRTAIIAHFSPVAQDETCCIGKFRAIPALPDTIATLRLSPAKACSTVTSPVSLGLINLLRMRESIERLKQIGVYDQQRLYLSCCTR